MMVWSLESEGDTPVKVTVPSQISLLDDLGSRLDSGQGFAVATINLDHVTKLRHDAAFREAYGRQSHVTADGNPIVWLERLSGHGDVELTTGSDLILPLAELAARKQRKVALFGSTEASLSAAKAALEQHVEGLDIALTLSPPMGFDPDGPDAHDAIRRIGESGAALVFLALGAPKQERFAALAASSLPNVGFVSIGAGLDFLSGRQTRAPKWMRNCNLEWLWRLGTDPRRMTGRYAAGAALLPGLTVRALKARSKV